MVSVKVIMQNIVQASILVNNVDEWKTTTNNRGVILYVCFMKGCSEEDVSKIVQLILQSKIVMIDNSKTSISEVDNFDILIVPQASIAGKLKNKQMQFHDLIDKDFGLKLYEKFIEECKELIKERVGSAVIHGTYGNRQGLKLESEGPFCQTFEI